MIKLSGVSRHFGGIHAVDALDLEIDRGEVVGLIGPNGSGKSTTINLISGFFPLTSGRISFAGRDISDMPVHRRAACGLARTFQGNRLFGNLTVAENLWAAQKAVEDRTRPNAIARWFRGPRRAHDDIAPTLEFSGLTHKKDELAANLSFAEQRRLELARALATRPQLLLLDEPAAGLGGAEIEQLREWIGGLRRRGMSILLVEHVIDLVMGVADRIAVLNFGRKIAEGTPSEIRANPAVREAYLGGDVQ